MHKLALCVFPSQKPSSSPYLLPNLFHSLLVLISSRYASKVFPCLQNVSSKSFITSSFTGFELLSSFPFALLAIFLEVTFQSFQSSSVSVCPLRWGSPVCVVRDLAVFPKFRFQRCLRGNRFVIRAHNSDELGRTLANSGEPWLTVANPDELWRSLANSGICYFGF